VVDLFFLVGQAHQHQRKGELDVSEKKHLFENQEELEDKIRHHIELAELELQTRGATTSQAEAHIDLARLLCEFGSHFIKKSK
jgi:hypothetical protein